MDSISLSSLSGQRYFTSGIPDVTITGSDDTSKQVTVTCDGILLLSEAMWPVSGLITLSSLDELLEPYVRKRLASSVTITAGTASATFTALYCTADVGMSAAAFYSSHFLTVLQGTRVTARGRREVLWYYGTGTATVTAEYASGQPGTFTAAVIGGSGEYTCIDVSPGRLVRDGELPVCYTVRAGSRTQRFEMDFNEPDCAPILEFYNSFGVWEMLYCTGTHAVTPEYKRSTARIRGQLLNYRIEETRTFKADTGILNTAMADWADELFRSDEVYVVNVINGTISDPDGGKEIVITESKSERRNDDDFLPRFTFSYQYSQRIHNVMHTSRVGRIFDNTFDHTFN